MRVIATAGHVDHGKSTLVRALTGMEPDRWAEERRRGLTIGLGFAWTELPDAGPVAFVDVPGHERFVPTMLAGVGPVPAVLFAVAADEGWMPQSTEHLAALAALRVRHGLLVITRADLADPGPAAALAREHLAGTPLADVPAVPVSARTGAGLPALRTALADLARGIPDADPDADVRLWLDRVFTVAGAGTVVTGTLAAGTVRVGDELVLAGTGQPVRVRAVQALGRAADEVAALARVAVNLRGHGITARHGDALITPDSYRPTAELDVVLDRPTDLPGELTAHVGAAAVRCRVRPLGDRAARLRLARPLPLRVADRLLLRDPGGHRVVAGADVLDVRPPELRRRGAARTRAAELTRLAAASPQARATALVRRLRFAHPADLRAAGLPTAGDRVAGWLVHPEVWRALAGDLTDLVARWAAEHPLDAGVPLDAVRRHLDLPALALVAPLALAAGLSTADGRVRGPEPAALPEPVARAVAAVAADLARAPFAAPDAARLAELGLGPRELAAAVRAGRLLAVAPGVVLLPDALTAAARELAGLPQPFPVSAARRAWRTSRRVAVPLLAALDRAGVTDRLPDTRRVLR